MKNVLRAMVAILCLAIVSAVSMAEDEVKLTTGETVRGEIIRELDGSIWVLESFGTVKRERFFAASQIKEIIRDVAPRAIMATGDEEEVVSRVGVPKAAVISLEGMVGLYMTADKLRDLIPVLEKELGTDGTGIVVFKINSGGGALIEIEPLQRVIHEEYKPRFQVAAWIESAISAAAMTSHAIENIYFMPEGNYGACTGWSGALEAMSGIGYERVVYNMEVVSETLGGYDPRIMKAMQGHPDDGHFKGSWPLSCTIDENGNVEWYQSADDGAMVINPVGEVLTFNSVLAKQVRFSKGTARNLDELTELLGYDEIEWIGKPYEGRVYPVSKAEAEMLKFRDKVAEDEARINEYQAKFAINLQAAQSAPAEIRGRFIGRARQHLKTLASTVRNNPNFAIFNFGVFPDDFQRDWYEPREELLREIARRP